MIWQGAFIDAARHWTGRGEGFEPPLGDNILTLPAGVAFAVLEKRDDAWPQPPREQGYRFRGYRLTPDDRPTFLYSFGDVKVEDFPNAMPGKDMSLQRTLKLSAEKPVAQLLLPCRRRQQDRGAGERLVSHRRLEDEAGGRRADHPQGRRQERNCSCRSFTDGKAQIVQEFVW